MKRRSFFILLLVLSGVFFSFAKPDQVQLEELFRRFVTEDQFGYTLFGDKPVSISGDLKIIPLGNLYRRKNGSISQIWEAWKQNAIGENFNNFLLFEDECKEEILNITLINKKACLAVMHEHLAEFKKELGVDFDPKKFLELVEKQKRLFNALNKSEELYGILLGFGKHNSLLYQRKIELAYGVQLPLLDRLSRHEFSLHVPKPSAGYRTIQEEFNELNRSLKISSAKQSSLTFIAPVRFSYDLQSPEAKVLNQKYDSTRKELHNIYSNGQFLEPSLKRLTAQ